MYQFSDVINEIKKETLIPIILKSIKRKFQALNIIKNIKFVKMLLWE